MVRLTDGFGQPVTGFCRKNKLAMEAHQLFCRQRRMFNGPAIDGLYFAVTVCLRLAITLLRFPASAKNVP